MTLRRHSRDADWPRRMMAMVLMDHLLRLPRRKNADVNVSTAEYSANCDRPCC